MPETVPTAQAITVKVDAPDGLPPLKPALFIHPETVDEFEAVVAAVGGPGAFRYYGTSDFATAEVDGATVYLHQPKDQQKPIARHPFMAAFAERIDPPSLERAA